MMRRDFKIINMSNKYRNNHNMRTSLVHCPLEKNFELRLGIGIYGLSMGCINDIYDNFATLQTHMNEIQTRIETKQPHAEES